MKRLKSIALALLMIWTSTAFAQNESSLLWEISGNGLEQPSYLFGTIHVKCPDEMKLSENTKKAVAETDQFALELDMDDPSFMAQIQQKSVNEGMKNISSELSEEDLSILNTFLKKHYKADMTQLGILKPFALLSMVFPKGLDCPAPASYEEAFLKLAKEEKEEVLGLETIDDQFAVFDKVSVKEQLGWVVSYAKDEEKLKKDIKMMLEVHEGQDIEKIAGVSKDFPEYKNLTEDLLYKRNEKWIAKMEAYAKEKPTFFAVGAAHLGSERGVVALLRKAGYTLTPIMN